MKANDRPEHKGISQAVLDRYNLLFNNVTYGAIRKALEEATLVGPLHPDLSDEAFITEVMNLVLYGIKTEVKSDVRTG